MIRIIKSFPPQSFKNDISKGARIYPDELSKDGLKELRKKLLDDQGYICCYCQRRIPHKNSKKNLIKTKSKIEHLKCQAKNPSLQLDFNNLYIACNGSISNAHTTCDTYKDDNDLKKVNFSNNLEDLIYYTRNGQIKSHDAELQYDIDDILNLNDENLMRYRESIFRAINRTKQRIGKKQATFGTNLKKEIKRWESKDSSGKFIEYKGVGVYFLKRPST